MKDLRRLLRRLWPAPSKGPGQGYFESWDRRSEDPWGHVTSTYEHDRYLWTLAALGQRRFARALEVGCSLGIFTEQLAAHCDELLAVDISEVSVARAGERLARFPHVRVERRTVPAEMPEGPFDLIVCADVLVYWTAAGTPVGGTSLHGGAQRGRRTTCRPLQAEGPDPTAPGRRGTRHPRRRADAEADASRRARRPPARPLRSALNQPRTKTGCARADSPPAL